MNEQLPPKETNFTAMKKYRGVFMVIIASILFFLFLYRVETVVNIVNKYIGYIMPIFFGIFIAYLLNPVVNFFRPKLYSLLIKSKNPKAVAKAPKKAKNLSIAVAIFICILLIVVLCLSIIPGLLESVIELGKRLPKLLESAVAELDSFMTSDEEWADSLKSFMDGAISGLKEWIEKNLLPTAQSALSYITSGVTSVLMFIYNLLVGIVVAVYALSDKEKFTAVSKKMAYAFLPAKAANKVIDVTRHGHYIFGRFLTGKIIDSSIVAVICFVFTLIAGIPYPLLVSFVIGITNIIPFFGPFIGGIPTTLLVVIIDPVKGLIFGIFIVILQQIDGNIIGARILGNSTGLSEFWITFALLLFGGIFGFIGMILGVPLFAVIYYMLQDIVNTRTKKKGFSPNSDFYLNVDKYDTDENSFVLMTEESRLERTRIINKNSAKNKLFNTCIHKISSFFKKLILKIKDLLNRKKRKK